MLVVGAVLVSLPAIAADLLLQWLQRILTPWTGAPARTDRSRT